MESFCNTKTGKWLNSLASSVFLFSILFTGIVFFASQVLAQEPAQPQPVPAQDQTEVTQEEVPGENVAEPEPAPREVTFPNGVKMEVLRESEGPKPPPNAVVHIQYIGHLEDGTEFARSYARRLPTIYALSDVIGCWQTGIPEMNIGSKAKFTCPPGSANAKRPVDFIWGDTTLYFVIELIAVVR